MFGIGMPEMLLILAVALIVIGPKKLPDLAKSLGRALGEFKRATTDLKDSIESETQFGEVKNAFKELKEDIQHPLDSTKPKGDSPSSPSSANQSPEPDPPTAKPAETPKEPRADAVKDPVTDLAPKASGDPDPGPDSAAPKDTPNHA